MKGLERAQLYWNTIRYLKPVQIRYQIKNRVFRGMKDRTRDSVRRLSAPEVQKISILITEIDCESGYLQRFDVQRLLEGYVTLLHEEHQVSNIWNITEASHLWNYNLHYLEFLIPLAARYRETEDIKYFNSWTTWVQSWLKQSAADSYEPYTISMRIPNMLISMELLGEKLQDQEIKHKIFTSVYRQYRYLLRTRELALLANHYFENLKTIVISSLLFGELDIYHKYFDLFLKELDEQILPDGLHFELSPMYHRIVLEGVLRVYTVLSSCCHKGDAEKLLPTIQAMALAMTELERGFDRIPLFNDSGNNVAKGKEALLKAAQKICVFEKKKAGEQQFAGYYKLYRDNVTILFDSGNIGPSYMGGHSHCDCLSFELCVDGNALFTNSGTGQYQGESRAFFRSTAAHNTMMLDDREQSQLWGEHRAGKRIQDCKGCRIERGVVGQFVSYQGDLFRRKMQWEQEGRLVITDTMKAHDGGKHIARQFFHLAPGYEFEYLEGRMLVRKDDHLEAALLIPQNSDRKIHTEGQIVDYAEDFGCYGRKQVLEICTRFEGEIQLKIEVEIQKESRE